MAAMHPPALFVTGTDTGVGKTAVAVAIVRQLAAAGVAVGAYKPVASGTSAADVTGDPWRLWDAAGRPLSVADVCPQIFRTPIAPADAARAEGRAIDESRLRSGIMAWRSHGFVVVEGAGGLCSPLADDTLVADLARDLGTALVIVDDARLGCIGRTLATVLAARSLGLSVAAVVLSEVADPGDDPGDDATRPDHPRRIAAAGQAALVRRLAPMPILSLPHGKCAILPPADWVALGHRAEVTPPGG